MEKNQNQLNTIVLPNSRIREIAQNLPQITGIRDAKQCLKLAEDSELFELISRKIDKSIKSAKSKRYEDLEKLLQEEKTKKAKWLESQEILIPESEIEKQVLLTWEHAEEWRKISKEYRDVLEEILDTEQTILIRASLLEEHLPEKLNNVLIARTLRYFKSDYMQITYEEKAKK